MLTQRAKLYPLAVSSETVRDAISPLTRDDAAANQPEVCSSCFGSGMEIVLGKGARRCRCRMQEGKARLLAEAHIPCRYEECSLANYHPVPGNGSQLLAFNLAFRLVDEYPAIDRGLLLMGTVGAGKTHPSNYPCQKESCATRDRHGY